MTSEKLKEWRKFRRNFGNVLHEKRVNKNYTLGYLSHLTGLSVSTLDKIECGKFDFRLYHLFLLEKAFER